MDKIKVKKLNPNAKLPTRAYPNDAGLDLYAANFEMLSNGFIADTGIGVEIPPGYVGVVYDRSSLGMKGLKIAGGIIDSGYTGSIKVFMWAIGKTNEVVKFEQGSKIAQLLILPCETPIVEEVTEFAETARGDKGFGSTDGKEQREERTGVPSGTSS